jgi:hypothetical protein
MFHNPMYDARIVFANLSKRFSDKESSIVKSIEKKSAIIEFCENVNDVRKLPRKLLSFRYRPTLPYLVGNDINSPYT